MNEHDQHILHSSEDPNWRTPPECYQKLDQEFDFSLDGAADSTSTLCTYYLGPGSVYGEDALVTDISEWKDHHVFLNPPFSRTLAAAYRTGKIKDKATKEWVSHPIDAFKADSYEIESWARWCWRWSQKGFTIVALMPFTPQTDWYRRYVYGHVWDEGQPAESAPSTGFWTWGGHAAREERRLPHRISFLRSNGESAANAGVNTAVIVWKPNPGIVGPWQPHSFYWSYR